MTSNIWTLITFIMLPNGELDGNNITYIFDSKSKCEAYLKSTYKSQIENGKQVEMKFNSSDNMYLMTIKNEKIHYITCRMSIAWE